MNLKLRQKLRQLPTTAGVYYHLDARGRIIYVGKAANLRQRVRQYFSQAQPLDPKLQQLKLQVADVQWTVTANAPQALLLESEMIKRYQPKYNVLQRNRSLSDWPYLYFQFQAAHPRLLMVKNCDEFTLGEYVGPYLDQLALRRALKYLRRYFPFSTHKTLPSKACLDYDLGLCPGPETATFQPAVAVANLKRLKAYLIGQEMKLLKKLQQDMQTQALAQCYERAAQIRDQMTALQNFKQSLIFRDLQHLNFGQDRALLELQQLFNLRHYPARIEAYDISHISGQYTTAAMVVAQAGILRPDLNRRFKSSLAGNNDVAQIEAVLKRRFQSVKLAQTLPDLILIDGGRGQVSAVWKTLQKFKLNLPVIGLAKKQEQLIYKQHTLAVNLDTLKSLGGQKLASPGFVTLNLPRQTHLIKLLQRLRDGSHRLAWRYHNQLQTKAQTQSTLLDLPSIGPVTYQKLLQRFGSLETIKGTAQVELAQILNKRQLKVLSRYLSR